MASAIDNSNNTMVAGPAIMPCACCTELSTDVTYWLTVTNEIGGLARHHARAAAMLCSLVGMPGHRQMRSGATILDRIRADLAEVPDTYEDLFHCDLSDYEPQFTTRHRPMTLEEWRWVVSQIDQCLTHAHTLSTLVRGSVRAPTIDRIITYRSLIVKAKLALESAAISDLDDWGVLYPRGGPQAYHARRGSE